MKEMERLTVPEPKYTIQAMDTPLVMDNDEDQRGLGYQNTLVSCLFNTFQSFFLLACKMFTSNIAEIVHNAMQLVIIILLLSMCLTWNMEMELLGVKRFEQY